LKMMHCLKDIDKHFKETAKDFVFEAIQKNRFDQVLALFKIGAPITNIDANANTVIHCLSRFITETLRVKEFPESILCEMLDQTRLLISECLSRGVDINAPNADGNTALHFAPAEHRTFVEFLIQQGSNPAAKNKNGDTPFMALCASMKEDAIVVSTSFVLTLLKSGVDIHTKNNDGVTALHVAVKTNNVHLVDYLLRAGADREAKTKQGKTPAHMTTNAIILELLSQETLK